MYNYRATSNGYHIKPFNSKSNINNRTKTNERTIKHKYNNSDEVKGFQITLSYTYPHDAKMVYVRC